MQRGRKGEVRVMMRHAQRRQMRSPGSKPATQLPHHGLHGRAALPEQHHLLVLTSKQRCWRRRRLEVHKAGEEGEDRRHRRSSGTDALHRSWQGLPCVALPSLD